MIPRTSAVDRFPNTQPLVDPDGAPIDTQIYDQLGELARFIDTMLKTITQFRDPMSATTEQLPQAVTHLHDLNRLTEEGTHRVMQLVEAIQANHDTVMKQLSRLEAGPSATSGEEQTGQVFRVIKAELLNEQKALTDIVTALSFQDLVAQRVNKLVTIVDEVERKLLQLVVVFGPYTKGAGAGATGKATEMLKQLEASKSTAMDQDLADEILKRFGFN
ncbi:MAG TPA: protein phosphatase CheZ [Nitrospira sp.]|nr:protein phosphatase CheZ [Nitrospira sp.]